MKTFSLIISLVKHRHSFWLALLVSGCAVYHPMTTDIPLISEKKDLRINAGISAFPSAQATVSYGLTDEIAIQGSGNAGADARIGTSMPHLGSVIGCE